VSLKNKKCQISNFQVKQSPNGQAFILVFEIYLIFDIGYLKFLRVKMLKVKLYKKLITSNHRGQSLAEVMVIVFIIIVGLSGTLSLLIFSFGAVQESESRVMAANFAREGIEMVRNIRDTDWLEGCPNPDEPENCKYWNSSLASNTNPTDYTAIAKFNPSDMTWTLEFSPETINDPETELYRDADSQLAIQAVTLPDLPENFTVKTGYRRLLTLNPICADGSVATSPSSCDVNNDQIGIDIQSHVRWADRGHERNLIVEEKIYNWR